MEDDGVVDVEVAGSDSREFWRQRRRDGEADVRRQRLLDAAVERADRPHHGAAVEAAGGAEFVAPGAGGDGEGVRVVDRLRRQLDGDVGGVAAGGREAAREREACRGARRIGEVDADQIDARRRQHDAGVQLVEARRQDAVVEAGQLRRRAAAAGGAQQGDREDRGEAAAPVSRAVAHPPLARLMTNE